MSGGYMCMIIIACHRLLNEPTPIIPAGNSNKVDWADFLKYIIAISQSDYCALQLAVTRRHPETNNN